MERTLISQTPHLVGTEVTISGWVHTRRNHGKLIFLDIRDRSGFLQVVFIPQSSAEAHAAAEGVRPEYVVSITGIVKARPEKLVNKNLPTGTVELEAKSLVVHATADTPPIEIDKPELDANIDTQLEYRAVSLRHPINRARFAIQATLVQGFREYLTSKDFTEIQSPKLVGSATEGGTEVFKVKYFDKSAYLAQSPQFYKQAMVGVFERVFETNPVYRAEKHATSRHLNEYQSLDLEMGFIKDHTDIMAVERELLAHMMDKVKKERADEIAFLGITVPEVPAQIPALKLTELQAKLDEKYGAKSVGKPDLDPEEEKLAYTLAQEEYNSEFIFVTHYPTKKRPMYTMPDDKNPDETKGFDLLFRGLEITTGGQRIHDYEMLRNNIEKRGLDPEQFTDYLQAFKYGMPPHGGMAIGLERVTMLLVGAHNVRETTLYPRDINRLRP